MISAKERGKTLIEMLCKIFAPEKALHNESLRESDNFMERRAARNRELTLSAMDLAREGFTVELKLTNSEWVEFRATPSEQGAYNGTTIFKPVAKGTATH